MWDAIIVSYVEGIHSSRPLSSALGVETRHTEVACVLLPHSRGLATRGDIRVDLPRGLDGIEGFLAKMRRYDLAATAVRQLA